MTKVYVLTNNSDKIAAVRSALAEIPNAHDLEVVRVTSRLLEQQPLRQPMEWGNIYTGAERRSQASVTLHGAGYHIGVQSGLARFKAGKSVVWMDQACIYVTFHAAGVSTSAFAASASVQVPDMFVERVKDGVNEIGAIVEFYSKREDKDAVAFFSRHYARRRDFIADAVKSAFGALAFQERMSEWPKGPNLSVVKK